MKNKIKIINDFIKQNKWIDIEFKKISHKEIVMVCSEDLDLPIAKSLLITFSNPTFIKSDLWVRSTIKNTQSSTFVSVVSKFNVKKIINRKLDKENSEFNLPAEILFKIQTGENANSYIAAESIDFKIIN